MARLLLVIVLLTAGCTARAGKLRITPHCPDGLPPQILVDPRCPPDGICGYSCLPGRWVNWMRENV